MVLDRGPIGKGMTSRTTAHLVANFTMMLRSAHQASGRGLAKLWYESQSAAVDRIEAIKSKQRHRLQFPAAGRLLFPGDRQRSGELDPSLRPAEESECRSRRHGRSVQRPGQGALPALSNQGTFHPLKYLRWSGRGISAATGGSTPTRSLKRSKRTKWASWITTGRHTCARARRVVATNSPINDG